MSKKFIRDEILNTARRLFNQRGYEAVSMRDIAGALGISVGNLTYHFPRKEELIEAVVAETHRYRMEWKVPTTLQEMNAILAQMQNDILQNAFYFWHHTPRHLLPEAVHQAQAEMVARQYELLYEGLVNLNRAGLLKGELRSGHYRQLAQAMHTVCVYWVPHSELAAAPGSPENYLDCTWAPILPLMTETGLATYHEKLIRVREYFEASLAAAQRPEPPVWKPDALK